MCSWCLKEGEDNTQKRREVQVAEAKYKQKLNALEFSQEEQIEATEEDYKAIFNRDTNQLRCALNIRSNQSPRDGMSNEALEVIRDLKTDQTSGLQQVPHKPAAKEVLKEEREKRRGLFW